MNSPAKEWKSYDEQVEILRSRGMVIHDDEQVKTLLSRIGYYRLSGYWYPFREFNESQAGRLDNFIEGTEFADVVSLYEFDRKLRLLALDAIERIELALQVEIAYLLGKRDPFAHENPSELHGNFLRKGRNGQPSGHEKWLEDFQRLVSRADRKTFVRHNIDKYGRLPIWVAIEIFDFGTMSKLFAGMKHKDKLAIESMFGLFTGNDFETWLRGFNFVRNTSAHHGRLWNCNILERANVPRTKIHLSRLNNSRPFLYFCLIQSVMKVICPASQWGQQFIQLVDSFPNVQNGGVKIEDMGIVEGWKSWPIWQ